MSEEQKNVTLPSSGETEVLSLHTAILVKSKFVMSIFDKVRWEAGNLLYPYTKIPTAGETDHLISGLTLNKEYGTTIRKVAKETLEDISPVVQPETALETLMYQVTAQDIEKATVNKLLADVNITTTVGAGADWAGIENLIIDMGSTVFNTVGKFLVVLSLKDYMAIIRDADYDNARKEIGDRVELFVSTQLVEGNMLIMHEYGVVGAAYFKPMEIDASPSSETADVIIPYRTGLSYDTGFIRKVTV